MKKFCTFILTAACLLVLGSQSIFASGLSFQKGQVKESLTLIDGVQWEKFEASSVNDEGAAGKQQVNVVTADKMSGAKVVSWAIPNVSFNSIWVG